MIGKDKLHIITQDGSEFILSNMKQRKEDIFDYGGLVVDFEPRFSSNFKLKWENNDCKKGINYVTRNFGKFVHNKKLNGWIGD